MSSDRKFVVFILTHGRPRDIKTIKSLQNSGYTGDWKLIVDDEDSTIDEYRQEWGDDRIIMFSKSGIEKEQNIDLMDQGGVRATITFARNACWPIAKTLGVTHFVQLDDDYTSFLYRWMMDDQKAGHQKALGWTIRSLDRVFQAYLDLLDATGAASVAMSQGGDFIGGLGCGSRGFQLKRKAMNSFFCRTDRPVNFIGRMNEDVNTYVTESLRGKLFFSHTATQLCQGRTQSSEGGITELYRDAGTYVKSMYTVIAAPGCTSIERMGSKDRRIHHRIEWNSAAPKIVGEDCRRI